jgi:hypothetical protein
MAEDDDRRHEEPPVRGPSVGWLEGVSGRTKLICGVVVSLVGAVTAVMGLVPRFTGGSADAPGGLVAGSAGGSSPAAAISIVDLQTDVTMADVFAGIPLPQERQRSSRAACRDAPEPQAGALPRRHRDPAVAVRIVEVAGGTGTGTPAPVPTPTPTPTPTPSPTPSPGPVPVPSSPDGSSGDERGIGIDLAAIVTTREGQLVKVYAVLADDSETQAGPRVGPIALRCIPQGGEDSWQDPVFVPVPAPGEWSVRLELWDESGTRIARSDPSGFTQETG